MATNIYTVTKDGEELDKVKTLAAAKKLADAEGAEVYSNGECVYRGTAEPVKEPETEVVTEAVTEKPEEKDNAKPSGASEKKPAAVRYRLKSLMNVREKPNGTILRMLPKGAEVEVISVENDWLHLEDGSFILFSHGEFAEKIV